MNQRRFRFGFLVLVICFLAILIRLFFWQVLVSNELKAEAEKQHFSTLLIPASRGRIFSKDGFLLASNEEAYLLYAEVKKIKEKAKTIAKKLAPLILSEDPFLDMSIEEATKSGIKVSKPKEERLKELTKTLITRLSAEDVVWVVLASSVSVETKKKIDMLEIAGLGFEPIEERFYPEASASAHILGFVGKDLTGAKKGYFGVEGFYDRELAGRDGKLIYEKDARGRPIVFGKYLRQKAIDGADIYLTIDSGIQKILETNLKKGIERFGAKGGLILVMEPTGAILGSYSFPVYNLWYWQSYESKLYKNPVVAGSFEPGSIMKPLIMAAAINEKKVKPKTKCSKCAGPRYIGGYEIETFDGKYHPNLTMSEVLINSDNTGMVYVGEQLGEKKMHEYLTNYGFGKLTGVDFQEEESGSLRDLVNWREIDLATSSFGQGVAVTPIQFVTAIASLANGGYLYKPYVVGKIKDKNKVIEVKPERVKKVLTSPTTGVLTEMLVAVCEKSPLAIPKKKVEILANFRIAAKSGTAQIPIGGKYSQDRTIASVVGYVPADEPKFVILVTLFEPKADPWGANTSGPIFFETAADLVTYLGVSP